MTVRTTFLTTQMGKISLKQNRLKMKGFVGVTDNDWFTFLSQQPGIDELLK